MLHLLIVDAEEDLLWALSKNLFSDRKDVKIRTASRGEVALETLKQNRVDVLITDTRVSGNIDGFNLILSAKDLAPEAKLVVTTEFNTEEQAAFQSTLGIAHFINKPFDIKELRDLISALEKSEEPFRGLLGDLGLADILALLCVCNRTVLLHLNHRGRRGRIEVVDGVLQHAEFDSRTGAEAVWTMLGLMQGDIFMQGDFSPSPTSVEQSWQEVLAHAGAWLEEHGPIEQEEAEVDIPIEGWDDDIEMPDKEPSAEMDDNPLGFSPEELKEMVMEDDLGHLEPPREIPSEDTLPRGPMLRPASQTDIQRAPVGVRRRGRSAMTIEQAVETLKNELPAFVAVEIVNIEEGASVAGAQSDDAPFEGASLAAYYGDLVQAALRAATAFPDAGLKSVQIATDSHYILARAIGAEYAQLAVIGREANLGIAQVVMRRLDETLAEAVPV